MSAATPRVCLFFKEPPLVDRWIKGDRYLRAPVRAVLRPNSPRRGPLVIFDYLCASLDRIGVSYEVNPSFSSIRPGDWVGIIGIGMQSIEGYDKKNPILGGVAIVTHPGRQPDLCERYPVARYLSHSRWVSDLMRPYYGDRCALWPCGIDTRRWVPPLRPKAKDAPLLVLEKFLWNPERDRVEVLEPVLRALREKNIRYVHVKNGDFSQTKYFEMLRQCRGMIYLCEHESQGLTTLEGMSSGVPVLAWDQGSWLDPDRLIVGPREVPASSVPFWDERCGEKFKNAAEFPSALGRFLDGVDSGRYDPRSCVEENVSFEKSAQIYVDHLREINR